MLNNLPTYLPITFGITTIISLLFFYWIVQNSEKKIYSTSSIFGLILVWSIIQSILSFTEFYINDPDAFPPRFLLVILPPLILIIYLFNSKKGKEFIDSLPLFQLTMLHTIRIPVELILFGLFLAKAIPQLMTFEGRNLDIIAGITAPLVAIWGIQSEKMSPRSLIIWNFAMLALLINIVVNAILSAPFAFQMFAFDQPNVAVLTFPFVLLPAVIVPLVLFAHLVAIRQLLQRVKS